MAACTEPAPRVTTTRTTASIATTTEYYGRTAHHDHVHYVPRLHHGLDGHHGDDQVIDGIHDYECFIYTHGPVTVHTECTDGITACNYHGTCLSTKCTDDISASTPSKGMANRACGLDEPNKVPST